MSKMKSTRDELSRQCQQQHQPPQGQESPYHSTTPRTQQRVNQIILKNMRFNPQQLTLSLHSPLRVKVSHNNSYQLSQISTRRKFIFSIEQLQIESDPIEQGQEYVFDGGEFNKKGHYMLRCISIPKMMCKLLVVEGNKENRLFGEEGEVSQQDVDIRSTTGIRDANNNNTSEGKLSSVQEQQAEQQLQRQLHAHSGTIPQLPSNFQEYERMLNEQLDSDSRSPTLSNRSESLESRYLNYFKQEFRLWRAFFQQQEEKKEQLPLQSNQQQAFKDQEKLCDTIEQLEGAGQNIAEQTQFDVQQIVTDTPSLITLQTTFHNIKSTQYKQHFTSSQSQNQNRTNNPTAFPPPLKINQKKNKKNAKTKDANTHSVNNNNTNNNKNNRNKHSVKPTVQHSTPTATPQKNLSLSQVKEIDLSNNNAKSQYNYELSSNSSSLSHQSTTPNSKLMSMHIHSHLHSHQEIVDRSHHGYSYFEESEVNSSSCRSNRKQTKKTSSQYGFNALRLQQQHKNVDRISVFEKSQQDVGKVNTRDRLSQLEKKQSKNDSNTTQINNKNNFTQSSRKSMSRTRTNSLVMREYKKQNNFLTWAIQWAKQKDYKGVKIQRVNDHHLLNQFNSYMKNRFKVTEFMYC